MDSSLFQPDVPQTSEEWKQVLADVKRDYLNRRHRHCSSRCRQLLDNVKAYRTAEPVHLIYLHFYAASALEMQANALHHSSPHKGQFIQQARDHYRRASVITEAESESASCLPSRHSSVSSSAYTPVLSEGTGGASTRSSSPALTFLLDEDEDDEDLEAIREKMLKKHHRKQVSFGGVSYATDPFIRPDSPTLGFDGGFGRPPPNPTSPYTQTEFTLRDQLSPISPRTPASFSMIQGALEEADEVEDLDPKQSHEHTQALRRYSSSLMFLQQQIATHMSDLETKSKILSSTVAHAAANHEMRQLELRARIARLKANGWRRQRFDSGRYEALREAAMADPS